MVLWFGGMGTQKRAGMGTGDRERADGTRTGGWCGRAFIYIYIYIYICSTALQYIDHSRAPIFCNSWWGVDLGTVHKVWRLTLYNRNDCCAERLQDLDIYIGNDWNNYASNLRVAHGIDVPGQLPLALTLQGQDRQGTTFSLEIRM